SFLTAPVHACGALELGVSLEAKRPTGHAHVRVAEVANKLTHRVRGEQGGGIREDDDLVAGRGHALVERARLAAPPLELDETQPGPLGLHQDLIGTVTRTVGHEDDIEPVSPVIDVAATD